jgi:hypothetical protein
VASAALFMALVLASQTVPATAGGGPPELVDSRLLTGVFAPDPEGTWRRIDETDSTSTCIGDPVTPLCAIETLHACLTRANDDLCQIAAAHYLGGPYQYRTPGAMNHYRLYRVTSVRRATIEDVRTGGTGINARRVGDILVETEWRPCRAYPTGDSCLTFSGPTTHTVRRLDGGWVVIDVYAPRY